MKTEIFNLIADGRNLLDVLERIVTDSDTYSIEEWKDEFRSYYCDVSDIIYTYQQDQEKQSSQNCKEIYDELQKQLICNGVWEFHSDVECFTYTHNDWKDSRLNFCLLGEVLIISVINTKIFDAFNNDELRRIYSDKEFRINGDTANLLKDVSEAIKYLIDKYSEDDYIPKSCFKQKAYMLYNKYINKLSEDVNLAGKWLTLKPSEEYVYELKFTPDSWSNYEIKFLFNDDDSTITLMLQMQKGVEAPSNLAELNEKYTVKYENELMFRGKLKPYDFYTEFEKCVADFIKMVEAGEKL